MKKTATTKTVTENITINNEKVNRTFSLDEMNALYNELNSATCKCDLVDTLNKYGVRTNTTPTTTKNANDLYFQLFDKSRVLITKKSLKVYTNDENAIAFNKVNELFYFDTVNDGSYRTKRATVKNTIENFVTIVKYFASVNSIALLPQIEK